MVLISSVAFDSHLVSSIFLLNPTLETGCDIHSCEWLYYYECIFYAEAMVVQIYSLYTHTHWHWCDIQKIVNLESRCCRISWILRNLVGRSKISKMNFCMDFFKHEDFRNYHWKDIRIPSQYIWAMLDVLVMLLYNFLEIISK